MIIQLKVKTLDSQTYEFEVDDEISLREFKECVAEKTRITPDLQRMIFCGRVLIDEKPLKEYNVANKVIHLVERPPPFTATQTSTSSSSRHRSDHHDPSGIRTSPMFRALDGMVVGTMTIPIGGGGTHTTSSNIPSLTPASSFCMNRIIVARHMLECANNIAAYLEDPQRGLNNPPMDILAEARWTMESTVVEVGISLGNPHEDQEIAEALHGAVSAALRDNANANVRVMQLATVFGSSDTSNRDIEQQIFPTTESMPSLRNVESIENMMQSEVAAERTRAFPAAASSSSESRSSEDFNSSANSEEGNANNGSRSRHRQRTSSRVLAQVVREMRTVQDRLNPFIEQYHDILESEPEISNPTELEETQRLYDRVSEALHYMSHAQHSISDLMLNLSQPAPRYLCCRPILVEQSGYVNTNMASFLQQNGQLEPIPNGQMQFISPAGNPIGRQTAPNLMQVPRTPTVRQATFAQPPIVPFFDLTSEGSLVFFNPDGTTQTTPRTNNSDPAEATRRFQQLFQQLTGSNSVAVTMHDQTGRPVQEPRNQGSNVGTPQTFEQDGLSMFLNWPVSQSPRIVPNQQGDGPISDRNDNSNARTATIQSDRSVSDRNQVPNVGAPQTLERDGNSVVLRCLVPRLLTGAAAQGEQGGRGVPDLNAPPNPPQLQDPANQPVSLGRFRPHLLFNSGQTDVDGNLPTIPPNLVPLRMPVSSTAQMQPTPPQPQQTQPLRQRSQSAIPGETNPSSNQARVTTATHPTTSTQTRSTSRPQVHVGNIPPWNARIIPMNNVSSFDRFLPCNSHHIRENDPNTEQGSQNRPTSQLNPMGPPQNFHTATRIIDHRLVPRSTMQQSAEGSAGTSERPPSPTPGRWFGSDNSTNGENDASHAAFFNRIRSKFVQRIREIFFQRENLEEEPSMEEYATERLIFNLSEILIFLPQYDLEGYDSRSSIEKLLRQGIVWMVRLITEDNSVEYGNRFFRDVLRLVRRCYAILVITIGKDNTKIIWKQYTNAIFGQDSYFEFLGTDQATFLKFHRNMMAAIGEYTLSRGLSSEVEEFIVRRRFPLGQSTDFDFDFQGVPDGPIPDLTLDLELSTTIDDVLPMDLEDLMLREGASGSTLSLNTESNLNDTIDNLPPLNMDGESNEEGSLPSGAQLQTDIDPDWIPYMRSDQESQRTARIQGPFSNAYISGMSAKRRKTLLSAKPPTDIPSLIETGVVQAIESNRMSTNNTNDPHPTPADIAATMARDNPTRHSLNELLRERLTERLRNDPDFDKEKFPNSSNYFSK